MENKNNPYGYGHDGYYGSASSSTTSFDHLFGPKDSSSSSSSLFGSIFPPPSTVMGRDSTHQSITGRKQNYGTGSAKYGPTYTSHEKGSRGRSSKDKNLSMYENETVVAEPCYLSSSIYYGGQENYSPRSSAHANTSLKKDDGSPDSASRGNWWRGSLYY